MRRKPLIRFLGVVTLGSLFVGCSKPPELPTLPRRETLAIQKIVLSDQIRAKDVRQIFEAINSKGTLDDLNPYFRDASDEALGQAGELLTKYAYQDQVLLSLIRSRFENRDFTRLGDWVQKWSRHPNFDAEQKITLKLWESKQAPELALRDINFLDPEVVNPLKLATDEGKANFNAEVLESQATVESPSAKEVAADLDKVLKNSALVDQILDTAKTMDQHYAGTSFLRALASFQTGPGVASHQFEGFAQGLRQMLEATPDGDAAESPYRNQLDLLFHLADTAHTDSRPLFSALQEQLAVKGQFTAILNNHFEGAVLDSISGWVQIKLNNPQFDGAFWKAVHSTGKNGGPTPQFNQLYDKILEAINQIVLLRKDNDTNRFVTNLPILLNAFALTKWFEKMVELNPDAFANGIGEQNVQVSMVPVYLVDKQGDTFVFPHEQEMTATALAPLLPKFRDHLAQVDAINGFRYELTNLSLEMPLTTALRLAVHDCDTFQSFSEVASLIQAFTFKVSHPDPESKFALAEFGTVSLMTSLNRMIGFYNLPQFRAVKSLLFAKDGFNLGDFDPNKKKAVLNLFADKKFESVRSLISELLLSAQALDAADEPASDALPSAFEVYYALLGFTASNDMNWISDLLSLFSKGRFFGVDVAGEGPDPIPLFPSLYKWVQSLGVAKTLNILAWIKVENRSVILGAIEKALGGKGTRFHVELLQDLMDSNRSGVEAVWERLKQDDLTINSIAGLFTDAEFDWAYRLIKRGDFKILWQLISDHGGTPELRKFIKVVHKLMKDNPAGPSSVEQALSLLTFINDTRVKDLANTLLQMYRNGEMQRLLNAAETFLG